MPSSTEPQGSPATSGTAVANWLADAGWPCTDGGVSLGRHADRPVTRWRTSHGSLVVKVFSDTDAAVRTYLAMTSLWHSPFGAARRPPGLPEPLLLLPGHTAVATRQVVGDVLPDGAEALCPFLPGVAELLADLHGSGCTLPRRRGRDAMLRSTRRKAADLRGAPAEAAWRVVDLMASRVADCPEPVDDLVPTHGDAAPHNLLRSATGLRLLDWDRAALAHPARDLAYFGASVWAREVLGGRPASWSILEELVAAYAEWRRPPAPATLQLYRACALVRVAHGWSAFRQSPCLAQRVLEEAEALRGAPRAES